MAESAKKASDGSEGGYTYLLEARRDGAYSAGYNKFRLAFMAALLEAGILPCADGARVDEMTDEGLLITIDQKNYQQAHVIFQQIAMKNVDMMQASVYIKLKPFSALPGRPVPPQYQNFSRPVRPTFWELGERY